MKKLFITLSLLLATVANAAAQTVDIDGLRYTCSGEEASVEQRSADGGYEEFVIPSTIEYQGLTFTVTRIESKGFYDNSTLKKIVIPQSIRKIGQRAFDCCPQLVSVLIPSSVEDMDLSFYACPLLRTLIYLPSKAPKWWEATTNTYVPDKVEYSKPSYSINNAKIIEMLTFKDSLTTYGADVSTAYTNNMSGLGYQVTSMTGTVHKTVGTWADTLLVHFKNSDSSIDVPNFDVKIPFHHTVKPATLTAKVDDVTCEYGEEVPLPISVSFTGFVNNDKVSVVDVSEASISCSSGGGKKTSPVGQYQLSLVGAKADNYEIVCEPGTLTVTKAPLSVRVKDAERAYGASNPAFQMEYVGLKNDETSPEWTTQPSLTCTANAKSNVGSYPITISSGDPRNYSISSTANGTLTVTKASLTVKASSAQRYYFEENPELTYSYSGFANGESETVLNQKPTVSTKATKSSPAGTYPITISGGVASNYTLSYKEGTLTVNKRNLSVTTPDYSRAYNEENPNFELAYDGFVNNEDESVLLIKPQATVRATKTSDVGTYTIKISGGEADNYKFSYNGGILTINKAEQTLTWEQDLSRVLLGDQVELTAKASSGLDVSYVISDNSFCSIYSAGNRTILDCYGTGSAVIRAVQEGNRNYYSSVRASKVLNVVSETGIGNVSSENSHKCSIYTIDGVKLNITDPSQLEKGVYIVDGKKVIVK